MTLNVLLTICFRYNSEEKSTQNSENEARQNWYEFAWASLTIKCLEEIDKIATLLRIYLESLHINFHPSQNVSLTSLLESLAIVTNERSLNLRFIYKFRFDWVNGKIVNKNHLMIIKINYVEDTKQQSQRGVLMKNVGDSVPLNFLD